MKICSAQTAATIMPAPKPNISVEKDAKRLFRLRVTNQAIPNTNIISKPQVSMFPSGKIMDKLYKNRVTNTRG